MPYLPSALLLAATLTACATVPVAVKPAPPPPVAQLPDEGLLGPAHAAHQNKLVFALRPIARVGAADETVKTAWLLAPIYARLFLGTSPYNLASRNGLKCPDEPDLDYQLVFRIGSINGASVNDLLVTKPITEELFKGSTSFSIADGSDDALNDARVVFPRDAWGDAMTNPKSVDFRFAARLVPRLREGTNTVVFRALASCGKNGSEIEVASGVIDLEVRAGDKERFFAAHGPTLKPFPAKEFSKLEVTGRQVYRDRFGTEPVRLFATSDWEYAQNRRQVSAAAVEQKDGTCTIQQFGLEQGVEGELRVTRASPEGPQSFPCVGIVAAR